MIISSIVPWATTSPPCIPARGPISTIWSAALMVSSSCSTTIKVLPRSRISFNEWINLSLSLWCKPILGSSRTYKTPESFEPIWVASLIRWASPPDKVIAILDNVKYSNPTSTKNSKRFLISAITSRAISCSIGGNVKLLMNFNNSPVDKQVIS